jgi:hypothetical protein
MGWTWQYNRPVSVKAEMDSLFTSNGCNDEGQQVRSTMKVLKSAIVNLRTYYCATEVVTLEGERYVFAGVCLLGYALEDMKFGYKDMEESMGPCEDHCPESILDLLTPTDREHAIDWRARCRANIALRKAKPKLTKGCVIKFDPPVKAGDGTTIERLRVLDVQKSRFYDLTSGQYIRAGWLKKCNYSIVEG